MEPKQLLMVVIAKQGTSHPGRDKAQGAASKDAQLPPNEASRLAGIRGQSARTRMPASISRRHTLVKASGIQGPPPPYFSHVEVNDHPRSLSAAGSSKPDSAYMPNRSAFAWMRARRRGKSSSHQVATRAYSIEVRNMFFTPALHSP